MIGFVCGAVRDCIGLETVYCPTCQGERGALLEHFERYGWEITCLACGDSWMDGELRERPFERGWRAKAIAEATKKIEIALRERELEQANE